MQANGKTAARPKTRASAARPTRPVDVANLEILFAQNPEPMYVYDCATLRFLEVNDAALKKYGYTREEFLRLRATDIRPAEDVPHLLKALRHPSSKVDPRGCWRHRRKSGQVFYVNVTIQRIRFRGRDACMAILQDVSARRAAEEEAAQRNAYWHAVMDNNPLAVVGLDLERRIQTCNPAFERLFGYRLADVCGKRMDQVAVPACAASIVDSLMKRTEAGEVVRVNGKGVRRDGSILDLRIMAVPLIINGEMKGTFGLFEDISEQIRAETARRQAEDKYRRIVDNAVEGIFESVPGHGLVTVNPALAHMAGYSSPAEMVVCVSNVRQLYADPQDQERLQQVLRERGFVEGFECQMLRKDGSRLWISMSVRETPGTKGAPTIRDGTIVDISGRKRSELERQVTTEIIRSVTLTGNLDELLRLIHAALNKVIDAENCFIALHDPATGNFHFPFHVDKFDSLTPPQNMGRSCTDYVFRTGRPLLLNSEQFRDLVKRGHVELVGTPSSSWIGVPLRTPAATIGVLVVQHYEREKAYTERDLEFLASAGGSIALAIERKRAEERARESEARVRLLIDQLPAVVSVTDKNLRFTSIVGADLAKRGMKPNDLLGQSLFEFFETSDATFAPIAAHLRTLAGESVSYQVEWRGGSYAGHTEPLRDAAGEVQGVICLALDVTERRRLEEQVRQSQKMEAVGRLAGGIAHDFNNLLMVIQGYADLLAERLPADDSLQRSAEQIQTAAQRAASLTRQLLAFSRRQVLAPSVLNIQSVVADMEKILRRLIGEDIDLEVVSSPDLWMVQADRSQIEQVILNLAVNARDAMPRGGRLTIETANAELAGGEYPSHSVPPGKYVVLSVTDNGVGMDEKTRARIFEPFFTTKEKGEGTGLGLATVYGVVNQSGGYVVVYSEPGRGSSFKIYLPRTEQAQLSAAGDDRPVTGSLPRGTEVILLAEDERGVRDLAREYLETMGYKVLQAENGHIALELAAMHRGPIHLLLTDVVMPGIGGRELAARIAAIRPDIKTLYMSGYADRTAKRERLLESEAGLLQKPFTLATLALKLREVLAAEVVA